MAPKRTKKPGPTPHRFGGDWTTAKLDVIAEYLTRYTTALKGQSFTTAYIDAFAGTPYRDASSADDDGESWLMPDLAGQEPQGLLDGSARRALKTEPRFNRYIFIERNAARCAELETLKTDFPDLASDILVRKGEANAAIQELCAKDWRSRRAVLFLDPYGMQVEWKTIEAIAATRAIDLWLLFPLGIGVNRLLVKSGDIPVAWRRRLDLLLGRTDWYEEFYKTESSQRTLFGTDEERVVKASTETIGRYFNKRLEDIFPSVAPEPKVLSNSSNCPLYLLCFAAGNEKGGPIALRIANHLLKTGVS